jgi:hypothetical protein
MQNLIRQQQPITFGVLLRKGAQLATCLILFCLILAFVASPESTAQVSQTSDSNGGDWSWSIGENGADWSYDKRSSYGAYWWDGYYDTGCAIELPHNTSYTTQHIELVLLTSASYYSSSYSLDGGAEKTIRSNVFYGLSGEPTAVRVTFNTTVQLIDGNHTICLKMYIGSMVRSATVHFTINASRPFIRLESPQNRTYHKPTIDLNYTFVDKERTEAKYSLDNKDNVTVSNQLSTPQLGNLTDGPHHIIIYAEDDFGNVYSAESSFEVKTSPLALTVAGIPVLIFLAAIIAPIAVALVLLIFFKRRKSKTA